MKQVVYETHKQKQLAQKPPLNTCHLREHNQKKWQAPCLTAQSMLN